MPFVMADSFVFDQKLHLTGLSSTNLSVNAQNAIISAVAAVLNVDVGRVTFLRFIITSSTQTNRLSLESIDVTVYTQAALDWSAPVCYFCSEALYLSYITSALTTAAANNQFDSYLQNAPSTPELATAHVTSADGALSFDGDEYSTSAKPVDIVIVVAVVIPVGVVLFAILGWCCARKMEADRINAIPRLESVLAQPTTPGSNAFPYTVAHYDNDAHKVPLAEVLQMYQMPTNGYVLGEPALQQTTNRELQVYTFEETETLGDQLPPDLIASPV